MSSRDSRGFLCALAVALLGAACSQPNGPTSSPSNVVRPAAGEAGAGSADVVASARPERADVMVQGGGGVYAPDGAMVVRQTNGLRISMTVPTPEAGSYTYAPGFEEVGPPEVFTLWAFVFNFPDLCDGPCNGNDVGEEAAAKGSVYSIGGHVAAGNSLTISGRVGVGEPARAPPGRTPTPLVNPVGAEIHVALAPHGALDPATLPVEFRRPAGSPACGCWWVAFFE